MKTEAYKSLFKRFPLLYLTAAVLCFLLFPAVILNSGINRILEIKRQSRVYHLQNFLAKELGQMEKFTEGSFFAHFLLFNLCKNANHGENPKLALKEAIKKVKHLYPGHFQFIVADKKGKIIANLSDINDFRYLYQKTFSFINEIDATVKQNYPGNPEKIKNLDQKIRTLRPLLGELLSVNDLCKPLLKDVGKSILVSTDPERLHLWFNTNANFRLLAYISKEFIDGDFGAKWATRMLNRQNPGIEFGFSRYPASAESIFPARDETKTAKTILALSKFEQVYPGELIYQNDFVFSCRSLSQTLRGFALLKSDSFQNIDMEKSKLLGNMFKTLLILTFILFVFRKRNDLNLNVKLKLIALFAYAILIPALLIAFLSWDLYQQKRKELIAEEQANGLKTLQTADKSLDDYQKKLAARLKEFIDDSVKKNGSNFASPENLKFLSRGFHDFFNVDEGLMTGQAGKNLLPPIDSSIFLNLDLFKQLGKNALIILNGESLFPEAQMEISFVDFTNEHLQHREEIRFLGIGDFLIYTFQSYIVPSAKLEDRLVLVLLWKMDRQQKTCLKQFYQSQKELFAGKLLFAFNTVDQTFFLTDSNNVQPIVTIKNDAEARQFSRSDEIILDGKPYIAVALKGNKLNKIIVSLLMPFDHINEKLSDLRAKGFAGLFIMITLILGVIFLNRKYLLDPLKELQLAVEAIGKKDFRFRSNLNSKNELGNLGKAFNHSLENLGELDLATSVKSTLLPPDVFLQNSLLIAPFFRCQSRLGGECFSIDQRNANEVSIFIGDTSGQGIPAALNMAMAKSVLIYENNLGYPSKTILHGLNKIFFPLKTQKHSDYLTGQVLQIDSLSGSFSFHNAGHTYPLLIKREGDAATFIKTNGIPIGFVENPQYIATSGQLENGDTILMITKGLIEAENKSGIPLGFDAFADMVAKAWQENLDKFQQEIINSFKLWSGKHIDEIPMIMIRFDK